MFICFRCRIMGAFWRWMMANNFSKPNSSCCISSFCWMDQVQGSIRNAWWLLCSFGFTTRRQTTLSGGCSSPIPVHSMRSQVRYASLFWPEAWPRMALGRMQRPSAHGIVSSTPRSKLHRTSAWTYVARTFKIARNFTPMWTPMAMMSTQLHISSSAWSGNSRPVASGTMTPSWATPATRKRWLGQWCEESIFRMCFWESRNAQRRCCSKCRRTSAGIGLPAVQMFGRHVCPRPYPTARMNWWCH